jgi:hypothetical protein
MEAPKPSPAELAARELALLRLNLNHQANAKINLFASAKMCSFELDPNFRLSSLSMSLPIVGRLERYQPITALLPEAAPYFEQVRRFGEEFPKFAEAAAAQPWTTAFASADIHGEGFRDWIQTPATAWDFEAGGSRAVSRKMGDLYLISPRELIGPDEDFRIEYTALAPENPCDLSVITGGYAANEAAWTRDSLLESRGYCFAFGAFENRVTELQRQIRNVHATSDVLITPGKAHRCVAERVGGIVRFFVDGRMAYSALDYLPLIGAGHGFVGLYTYAARHAFWDLQVRVRPTCLPPPTLAAVHQLRKYIVELKSAPARFVEMHYAGGRTFLVRDVTAAVIRQQELETERHNREKLEAFLALAATAAHEMNQPLTVILCGLDLLAQQQPNLPPDFRARMDDIRASARRLSEIVRQISDIRQYETKPYVGGVQMVDLDAASGPSSD